VRDCRRGDRIVNQIYRTLATHYCNLLWRCCHFIHSTDYYSIHWVFSVCHLLTSPLVTATNGERSPFSGFQNSPCLIHSNSWLAVNSTGNQLQISSIPKSDYRHQLNWSFLSNNWTDHKLKSKSKSRYDWWTVSQSVSMSWCQAPSGSLDQVFLTVWRLLSCLCGAPSLTRGWVCRSPVRVCSI
jgi:hypothetical protein